MFVDVVRIVGFSLNRTQIQDEQRKLYGFYKQATIGDVNTERPDSLEFTWRTSRWVAWKAQEYRSKEVAKAKYVALVEEIVHKHGLKPEHKGEVAKWSLVSEPGQS